MYIIVMDNSNCFISKSITKDILNDLENEISYVIRCSDACKLNPDGSWSKLPHY